MLEGTLIRRTAGKVKRRAVRELSAQRVAVGRARQRLQPRRRVYDLIGRELPLDYGRPFYAPASFDAWVARTGEGRPVLYPANWRSHRQLIVPEPARVAVLFHAHFPELVDEVLQELKHIPVAFDLIVTNSSGAELVIEPTGLMRHCTRAAG